MRARCLVLGPSSCCRNVPPWQRAGIPRAQALAEQLVIVHPEREMACTKERRDSLPLRGAAGFRALRT